MKICCVDQCKNKALAKEHCRTHYMQLCKYGKILVYTAKEKEYKPLGRREKACSIAECENKAICKGMCTMHYARDKRHGSPFICYSRPRKPKDESMMRDERRYRLTSDEQELLSEIFKEGVGINEGETVMHYE